MTKSINNTYNLNPITFTLFGSTKDNKVVHENVRTSSWGEFKQGLLNEHDIREGKDGLAMTPCGFLPYDHKDVELLDGQTCEDGKPIVRRCSLNITDYSMLVIDIDDGNSLEEIIEFFNEYECVVTSSHNHMVDEVVKVRVYLLLKQAVNHEEIKKRKNKLLSFFPNPDSSTFAASRVFYLPSVPEERKNHASINEFHGELFDVLEFKPDEVEITQKSEELTIEPLSLQAQSQITQGLKKVGRVDHESFYKIAAGMHASGFTLHDFLDVAPYLKPSYSSRALESQWWYSQKLDQIKTGTLIHILKDLGIKVVGIQKNNRKKIDELNKKIDQVKANIIPFLNRTDLTEKEEEQREQNETYYESLLDKKQALLKAENDADNLLNQLLDGTEVYYVADVDKLLEYKPDQGVWLDYKIPAFLNLHPFIKDAGGKQQLMTKLGERGALRKTVCISAKSQPEYVLNKFRKDHWLQPSRGDYHEIFDLFIRSLGDDKQENMTHIKSVVAWKYLYPEDYSLPCLVIFGQGGAGKTSFVTTLLATIFGRHQTIAIQQESMKNFNGIVAGKIAVSLEESVWDKADKNHLKTIIGQRTVMVNEKYGRQYDADNISLYVCGGNGALGAVKLGRDQSDRRFSILKVTRSIIDHVMEVKLLNRDDAIDWWERNKKYLEDKNQVSCWLGSIIPLVEEFENPPIALHGEDYQALLKAQSGPFEEIIDMVFDHPSFEFINSKEAYELFKLLCEENGYSRSMTKTNFDSRLENELHMSHTHIKFRTVHVIDLTDRKTTNRGWVVDSLKTVHLKHHFVIDHDTIKGKRIINNRPFGSDGPIDVSWNDDLMED